MGLCGERWNGVLLLHRKQCLIMNIMMINEWSSWYHVNLLT
jgi:hypothetical protein